MPRAARLLSVIASSSFASNLTVSDMRLLRATLPYLSGKDETAVFLLSKAFPCAASCCGPGADVNRGEAGEVRSSVAEASGAGWTFPSPAAFESSIPEPTDRPPKVAASASSSFIF